MASTLVIFVLVAVTVMFSRLNQRSVQLGHTVVSLELLANQLAPIALQDSFVMIPGSRSRFKLALLAISVLQELVRRPKLHFVNPGISAAAQMQHLNLAQGESIQIQLVVCRLVWDVQLVCSVELMLEAAS